MENNKAEPKGITIHKTPPKPRLKNIVIPHIVIPTTKPKTIVIPAGGPKAKPKTMVIPKVVARGRPNKIIIPAGGPKATAEQNINIFKKEATAARRLARKKFLLEIKNRAIYRV